MKPECKSCKFFVPIQREAMRQPSGQCHRMPPTSGRFPLVEEENWCGEFQAVAVAADQPTVVGQPKKKGGAK